MKDKKEQAKEHKDIIIQSTWNYPDDNVSDEIKNSIEYGTKIGRAILSDNLFVQLDNNSLPISGAQCSFFNNYISNYELRLRSINMQDPSIIKSLFVDDGTGDASNINLNWQPLPIIQKYIDLIVNKISGNVYEIVAKAEDSNSIAKRMKQANELRKDMIAKPFLSKFKKELNVDLFSVNEDDVPDSEEEANLYAEMNKLSIEIAQEIAISTIFKENSFEKLEIQLLKDIVTLGAGVVKTWYSAIEGIKIEYVDFMNFIYSPTRLSDFSDCFYFGEIKPIHITDLLHYNPNLTSEEISQIRATSQIWYTYYNNYITRIYGNSYLDRDLVFILHFSYKTFNKKNFKIKKMSNGGEKVIEKYDDFNPEPNENFYSSSFKKYVWYEGVMPVGYNKVIKWGLQYNTPKNPNDLTKTESIYSAYAPNREGDLFDSATRRMIGFENQLQLIHLKLQQVTQRTIPDGVMLDYAGFENIQSPDGKAYSTNDLLKLIFETGSVVANTKGIDEFSRAIVPVTSLSLSPNIYNKINALLEQFKFYNELIRNVVGFNNSSDASTISAESTTGANKLAANNTETAIKHISNARNFLAEDISRKVSYLITDNLKNKDFKEKLENQIGVDAASVFVNMDDLALSYFGIYLVAEPTEEEKLILESNIQAAIKEQTITVEDVIQIRNLRNLKLATKYLQIKAKKNRKSILEMKEYEQNLVTESNIKSSQASSEYQKELELFKVEQKIREIQAEGEEERKTLILQSQLGLGAFKPQIEKIQKENENSQENLGES